MTDAVTAVTGDVARAGLAVDRVTVRYGATVALDRLSIEVAAGEVLGVVGPSGSGKSTLLRAVAGLEPLVEGRIVLAGRDLSGVPTHRRGLGLMFQDHGLFTHLTVADNIAYGLRIAGAPRQVRERRVAELLEMVGLAGFEGRRTDELSGGEAQRVALARALAPSPGLLMLDEPLGSLDRVLRDQLVGDLRRLLTELGQTALHVTHDQAEAFAIADRVAVLADGRLRAVGRPSELWADPGSRFVAEFLGHPNIWSVQIGDGGVVTWAGRRIGQLPTGHTLRAAGPRATVVVPETAIHVAEGPDAGAELTGTVTEVVFRGGRHDATLAAPGGDGGPCTIELTSDRPVVAGERLSIRVDLDALRPLDRD